MQPLSSAHVFHGRYSQFLFIFLQSLAVIFLSSRQNCSTNHFRNQLRSWKQTENKPHIIEFGFRTFFGFLLHIDLALLIFDRWKLFPRMALKMIVAGMQQLWGGLTWGNQLWGVFFGATSMVTWLIQICVGTKKGWSILVCCEFMNSDCKYSKLCNNKNEVNCKPLWPYSIGCDFSWFRSTDIYTYIYICTYRYICPVVGADFDSRIKTADIISNNGVYLCQLVSWIRGLKFMVWTCSTLSLPNYPMSHAELRHEPFWSYRHQPLQHLPPGQRWRFFSTSENSNRSEKWHK